MRPASPATCFDFSNQFGQLVGKALAPDAVDSASCVTKEFTTVGADDCSLLSGTQDTVRLNAEFLKAWETRDYKKPRMAAITFYDLRKPEAVTPSLFDEENDRSELNHAVDDLNQKFGKNTIYLAGMKSAKDAAEERIAFNKTWLFKEGKDDNVWVDTFRGNKPKRDKPQ